MESPLALNSVSTRVGIFLYSFMIFLGTEYQMRLEFSQRSFFLLVGYLSQLIFMIFQTSRIGFNSRESPGHSKTDVPLISRMYFANLGLIQRTLPSINTYSFRILYWHVNCHDLNLIEEVWNIMKSCESLPDNKFSPLWYSVWRNKSSNCMMKCQHTFWRNKKPEVIPQCFKTCFNLKESTSKLSSYNRPGGMLVFLQNNIDMLSFIL